MVTQNSLFINRRFHCTASVLFDYLTQPRLIATWFGPKHVRVGNVQTDVRIGGAYSIELIDVKDRNFLIRGEYTEIEFPNKLTFSLEYQKVSYPPPKSMVKIRLEELTPDHTMLILTQEFEIAPPDMENRNESWEHMFSKLDKLLRAITYKS